MEKAAHVPVVLHAIFKRIDQLVIYIILIVTGTSKHCGLLFTDTWWHLRLGKDILSYGPPFVDSLSHTFSGHPFVDHQWLAEPVFYLALKILGPAGVPILGTILSVAVIAILWRALRKMVGNHPIQWAVIVISGVYVFSMPYSMRPAVFGEVLLAILVAILALVYNGKLAGQRLFLLPGVFALWANLHLSWTAGLLMLAVFGVGSGLETGWRSPTTKRWGLVTFLCIGALFINPYFWKVPLTPLRNFLVSTGNLFQYIQEWRSPSFSPGNPWSWFVIGTLLLPWLVFVAVAGDQKPKITEVLLVVACTFPALISVRFLLTYGIVIPLVITPSLVAFWNKLARRYPPMRPRSSLNVPTVVFLIEMLFVVLIPLGWGAVMWKEWDNWTWHLGIDDGTMPAHAVAFLEEHPEVIQGQLLNPYEWGGFLSYWLPQTPVFIDGRTDFYASKFLEEYMDLSHMRKPWEEQEARLVSQWGVGTVLWYTDSPVAEVLRLDSDWDLVWEDETSLIFVRQVREAQGPSPTAFQAGFNQPER